jgi:uncharacterized protein (TIGR02391 family)
LSRVNSLPESVLEPLARLVGECGTGSQISRILNDHRIEDNSNESTKWRRLYHVFLTTQKRDGSSNRVLGLIESFLHPARFVGQSETYESHRSEINATLSFFGLKIGDDGRFRQVEAARSLSEAERRANTIHAKFRGRRMHPEVLKYCRAELMNDDYFHAVLEAVKGLAQRIRDKSSVEADGAALVDQVFSVKQPLLVLNMLQTETEQSEHKGFALLLKGCFAAIRNPRAHEPRILWKDEEDAADCFTLISLLHWKLDDCVPTRPDQVGV